MFGGLPLSGRLSTNNLTEVLRIKDTKSLSYGKLNKHSDGRLQRMAWIEFDTSCKYEDLRFAWLPLIKDLDQIPNSSLNTQSSTFAPQSCPSKQVQGLSCALEMGQRLHAVRLRGQQYAKAISSLSITKRRRDDLITQQSRERKSLKAIKKFGTVVELYQTPLLWHVI